MAKKSSTACKCLMPMWGSAERWIDQCWFALYPINIYLLLPFNLLNICRNSTEDKLKRPSFTMTELLLRMLSCILAERWKNKFLKRNTCLRYEYNRFSDKKALTRNNCTRILRNYHISYIFLCLLVLYRTRNSIHIQTAYNWVKILERTFRIP